MAFTMSIFVFTLFLRTSASSVPETQLPTPGNSSSPFLPVESQSLTFFLPAWKSQLEQKQARINGWMDSNQDTAEKIMVLAVLLMLVKAFWVWGCKSLGVWGEWLEERERMERVREWIIEERRMRREKCPVVGILRAADDKGVVRKRVSFEEEERVLGNGEGRDELEGQRKGSENEKFMIEEVKCEGLVIDGGLPLRCSQESLTV